MGPPEHMHAATIFHEPETLPSISPEEAKSTIIRKFKEAAGFEEISCVDFIQDSETKDILDAIEYWLSKTEKASHTSDKISPANFLNLMKCGWLVRRIAKYKMPEETRIYIGQSGVVSLALFLFYLTSARIPPGLKLPI